MLLSLLFQSHVVLANIGEAPTLELKSSTIIALMIALMGPPCKPAKTLLHYGVLCDSFLAGHFNLVFITWKCS